MNKSIILIILSSLLVFSCATYRENGTKQISSTTQQDISVTQSVVIAGDGSSPNASSTPSPNPSRTFTFTNVGQKLNVKNGEVINFIYDGIDPEVTYITYESTDDGFMLELNYRNTPINVVFQRLCHSFVVANPNLTSITVPQNLKYEQIIWTPREDGTWEVRIGAVERGCTSQAVQNLNKLRNKTYEKGVPKK